MESLLPYSPNRMSPRRWALFSVLLAFAFFLRAHGLGEYPRPHQTHDEYHYLWAGLSLMEDGTPTSWSILKGYELVGRPSKMTKLFGYMLPIVTPAVDHPPLFSLLAAGFATCAGAEKRGLIEQKDGTFFRTWKIDLTRARWLALTLFVVTFFLLFQLAREAFSFSVACWAAVFYAVISHIIFHNRLLVTENLTTPLFLLNLCALQRYTDGRTSRGVFGAVTILTIAAALLTKVIAVSQAAGVIAWLLYLRRPKDIVFPVVGVVLGVGLFLAYGWWQGWDVFWGILKFNSERFTSLSAFTRILTKAGVVHTQETSYLLMAGWIALFAALFRKPKSGVLLAPAAYLLSYAFFASVDEIYGWHIVPFYPFLCLALAVWVARALRHCNPWDYFPLVVLLLPAAFSLVQPNALAPTSGVPRWVYLLACCAALGALAVPMRLRRVSMRAVLLAALLCLFSTELMEIWVYLPKS